MTKESVLGHAHVPMFKAMPTKAQWARANDLGGNLALFTSSTHTGARQMALGKGHVHGYIYIILVYWKST